MNIRTPWVTFFFGFLFFLPIQTVILLREPFVNGEKWQYGMVGVYATDIFLLSALVAFAVPRIFSGPGVFREGFFGKLCLSEKILFGFLLWSGLSLFWASDTILAAYFFLKLFLACGIFFLARSLNEKEAEKGMMILAVGAVFQAVFAIWQFLSQTSFASTLLGMSEHESWVAGTSVLKNESGRWLRGYGTLPHPNILGGFLGAVLILTLGARSFRLTAGTLLILAFLFIGLIFTFSRSAWLGLVIGLSFLFLSVQKKRKERKKRDLGIIFIFLSLLGAGFFFLMPETIAPRFENETLSRERSISDRIVSLLDAKTLAVSNPVLGVGIGNSTAAIMKNDPMRPIFSIQPAHNVFFLVFAELGIVGLVFFVLFLVSLFKNFLHRGGSASKDAALFSVIALFPSLFLDHWLFTSHFGIFLLFFLLGLSLRCQKHPSI